MKLSIKIIISTIILMMMFISYDSFARAGGGGGGSGGGGKGNILILIVWAIYTGLLTLFLFLRKREAINVIKLAKDHIWDIDNLNQCTEKAFYAMQDAWSERNLDKVSSIITYNLYQTYHNQLEEMKEKKEKNMLDDITLNSIQIISCKDYTDDSKDSFTAYITGSMADYTIQENTGKIITNENREVKKFKDCYIFTRDGNTWLLNEIVNDAELYNVVNAESYTDTE